MFDYLYEWVCNLACYLVLITAFTQMLPNQTYKKYIRFFTGMLLILLLLSPVLKLFGVGKEFSALYESRLYEQQIQEMEEASRYLESIDIGEYFPEELQEIQDGGEKRGKIQVGDVKIGE